MQYIFYTEVCDGVKGCVNSTCKSILGWNCTVNITDWSSKCTQTCGDNVKSAWEICDDGNNVDGDGCA